MSETLREFRDRHNAAQTDWDDLVGWLWMAHEDAAGLREQLAAMEKRAERAEAQVDAAEAEASAALDAAWMVLGSAWEKPITKLRK
jgi:hypothetical protein